jgi:RNA recognition motif-containing protein
LGKRLYVGNIPFSATEEELGEGLDSLGAVSGVDVIMDRETGDYGASPSSRCRIRRLPTPRSRGSMGWTSVGGTCA